MLTIGTSQAGSMIGLIVGMGRYRNQGEIAARQFHWATGLAAWVVTDEDLGELTKIARSYGMPFPESELPYFARLLALPLVEAEQIVYLDANVIHLNRWDPTILDANAIHAVRDRGWFPGIQEDCHLWGLSAADYFNSGLLVLGQQFQDALLEEIVGNWKSMPSVFHDQTRLNAAVKELGIPLHFLHRDHNLLGSEHSCELGQFAPYAVHLPADFAVEGYLAFLEQYQEQGVRCIHSDQSELAIGRWVYERQDGSRILELQADGTVGEGMDRCERFWRLWDDGQLKLAVFGDPADDAHLLETFQATFDGTMWRGHWNQFEQDEVRLRPIDSTNNEIPHEVRVASLGVANPNARPEKHPTSGNGDSDPNDVAIAMLSIDRNPQYVFQALSSMFIAEPTLHQMDPVWLMVGSDDASYLRRMLHHERVRVVALSKQEATRIRDWRLRRKFKHNYHRCLRVPLEGKRGLIVAEDDVVFRDHFVTRCLRAVEEMEADGLEDYALALFAAYDFEQEASFYRGKYYCSYGWEYYGTPCMYYPKPAVERLSWLFERFVQDDYEYEGNPDAIPGDMWIKRHYGRRMYATTRALAQHVGEISTGLGGGGGTIMFDRPYQPLDRDKWGQDTATVKHQPYIDHDLSAGFLGEQDKSLETLSATPNSQSIPKIIHHVWIGPRPLPDYARANIETWQQHHPDWELRLWTDENLPPLQNKLIYSATGTLAQKSDILRLEVLRLFGGVYVDTDVECLRNIEPLIRECDFFYGDEKGATPATAIIGSTAGHPFAQHLVNRLADRWPYTGGNLCLEETGPRFFKRAILSFLRSRDIRPYNDPRTGIYCGNYLDIGTDGRLLAFIQWIFYPYYFDEQWKPEEHPDAYVVHHWKRDWGCLSLAHFRPGTDDTKWVIPEIIQQDMYRAGELARELEGIEGVVVDCGAHIGAFACWLAHHGVRQPIKAFEPEPENFVLLEQNCQDYGNIEAIPLAVSISEGDRRLYERNGTGTWSFQDVGGAKALCVKTISLADYLQQFDHIALLKLDLEGHEAEVINSMPEEILSRIGILILETHDQPVDYDHLWRCGFTIWFQPYGNPRHMVLRRVEPFHSWFRKSHASTGDSPKILLIADIQALSRRMCQDAYLPCKALMAHSNVHVVGPQDEFYRPGMPIAEIFERIGKPDFIIHTPDMGATGLPLASGLESVEIPKAIQLIDTWNRPDTQKEFINRLRFDFGFSASVPFIPDYQASCPNCRFIWTPHPIDATVFRDYQLEKDINILLYGNVDENYPLRQRLHALLSRPEVQEEFRVHIVPHPGYHDDGYVPQADHFVGESLARLISRTWIGIATASKFGAMMMKHLEISAAGALVAGSLPTVAGGILGQGFVELDGLSDDQILATFRQLLAEKQSLLDRIQPTSRSIAARFSLDAYAHHLISLILRCIDSVPDKSTKNHL